MMATGGVFEVTEVGIHTPKEKIVDELTAGDVVFSCIVRKNHPLLAFQSAFV